MIISIQKPLKEIMDSLTRYRKIAIIGCGGCAAVCQSGGTKQVEQLIPLLEDKEIVFSLQIDEPCDKRVLSREIERVSDRLEEVAAILVLACGTGVQMVAESVDRPCIEGLNTLFAGGVVRLDNYVERCQACGECILNITTGLCPRTLCPKGITNGPCSEKTGVRCSVDEDSECVWERIAGRIEKLGIPSTAVEIPAYDWSRRIASSWESDSRIITRRTKQE
jgi:ferredoxin